MPPSLPVPSKGALRTLRHIALGTSCTVAFGAGLITEDRRRRIHSAREASDNARCLKASRKYHSAGVSAAATFEEQVDNYCKYGPWKSGDKKRMLDPDWEEKPPGSGGAKRKVDAKPQASTYLVGSDPTKLRQHRRINEIQLVDLEPQNPVGNLKLGSLTGSILDSHKDGLDSGRNMDSSNAQSARPGITRNIEPPKSIRHTRPPPLTKATHKITGEFKHLHQEKTLQREDGNNQGQMQLALRMSTLLKTYDSGGATRIRESISAFHEDYRGYISLQPVCQDLLDVCVLLAQECDLHKNMDIFIPVLTKILSCGHPIDEEFLHKLHAKSVIARLLEQSGYRHADYQVVKNVDKLKHAVAIFIVRLCENPKPLSIDLRELGLQLCTATVRGHLYDMAEAVYWRLLCGRTDATAAEVECLILAEHRRAFGEQVIHHFSKYFSKTLPSQEQFYTVVGAAIDSAIDLNKMEKAEMILLTASEMARNLNLRTSTKWYLRFLGEHWRTTKDIKATRALFDRSELDIEQTSHPRAIYSAIIQFCIEAGSENEIRRYMKRLVEISGGDIADVRTLGHLALAKAMKNDWAGVEADFCHMKRLEKGFTSEHSSVFVPVLKLFIASHSVSQIQDFLRLYLDSLRVMPNQYIFNIVVDAYCRAGELAKIPPWIEYVQQHGLKIDAITVNTILSSYRKKWDIQLANVDFYKEAKDKLGPDFNSSSISIFRRTVHSPATHHRVASLRKVNSPTRVPQSEKLDLEMSRSFEHGNYTKVLKSYKFAVHTGKRISQQGFSLAVQASIRSSFDGNIATTVGLITEAKPLGFDILPSIAQLLLHQVSISDCNGDDLLSLVQHTIVEFNKYGLAVTLFIASKVVGQLIDRRKPRESLLLWNILASNDHLSRQPMDLVLLTVLLRAYVMLYDIAGIRWVMNVLLENNIIPDMRFKQVIKNARREARRNLDTRPENLDAKRLHVLLDECLQVVVSQRLNSEINRKEAEQLTLSIIETALSTSPMTSLSKPRLEPPELSHVKRSQRLRNPNEIWKRLGKYGKMGKSKIVLKMNSHPLAGGKEGVPANEHLCVGGGFRREEQALDVRWRAAYLSQPKQTLSGRPGSDVEPFGGDHKFSSQAVEIDSG